MALGHFWRAQVMMYCTGGIRCERASALLDQMETATQELKTEGVFMVRV